jgi:ribosomal protein S18 acetylase RimI-like enzyme
LEWIRNVITRLITDTIDTLKDDSNYVEMRLPVIKISQEFERALKQKEMHNASSIKVREARLNDIDNIMNLHEQTWKSTLMPYKAFSKELLSKAIDDSSIIFLIMEVNDRDVGFALIYYTGLKLDIGMIAALGIIPEFQRGGLGTALGLSVWDFFKRKGVKELRCKVSKENKIAYSFIRSLGFEELN